jgi:hypothetical protein
MACVRRLQRMGEDVRDDELARLDVLAAEIEREFAALRETAETKAADATHG